MKKDSPSATAQLICRSIVYLIYEESSLVKKEYLPLLQDFLDSFSKNKDLFARLLRKSWVRNLIKILEYFILPNLITHYGIRKRIIRTKLRKLLSENQIHSLIHLGAGFDTYGIELKEDFPFVHTWEIDHPATQKVKTLVQEKHESRKATIPWPKLIPMDIQNPNDLPKLDQSHQPVCILAEGLFMYLSETEIQAILKNIRESYDHAYLLFTFLEVSTSGKPNFYQNSPIVNLYLKWKGEPFLWGIGAGSLPSFLEKSGFRFLELISPAEESEIYLGKRIKKKIQEKVCLAILEK
jgi:O-methyltransferase involved in polyketide biosynthesis